MKEYKQVKREYAHLAQQIAALKEQKCALKLIKNPLLISSQDASSLANKTTNK